MFISQKANQLTIAETGVESMVMPAQVGASIGMGDQSDSSVHRKAPEQVRGCFQ